MSSGQHTPRRAPSLRDLSRHDLKAVLSHDQQRTADNRPVPYVARIGRDRHLVRNPGSDIIYSVGGPAYSFKPGTVVLLGSNTGRPGESIIALPSPAQRGASAYPESRFGGDITFPAPEDPPDLSPTSSIQMLAFWRGADTDLLECWEVLADGSPGEMFSTVEVEDQLNLSATFTDRGRRMSEYQSIVHSGAPSTALTWFNRAESAPGSGNPSTTTGYLWMPEPGTLVSWLCATPPFPESDNHRVGAPFESGGFIYWIQHDGSHPTNASKLRLYRIPVGGGSPSLISTRDIISGSPSLVDTLRSGCPNSSNFITTPDGLHWFHKSDGNDYSGSTTGDTDKTGGTGWRPLAGNGGSGDWGLWFDRTPSGAGKVKRMEFDEASKSWDNLVTWATGANSSHTGADCMLTVNVGGDTAGMYPHNGPEAGGGYLKLFQPLGTSASEGNDGSDPRIFIQARGGHVPHFVHLVNYSHPWS